MNTRRRWIQQYFALTSRADTGAANELTTRIYIRSILGEVLMKQRTVPTVLCSSSIRGSEGSKKRVTQISCNTFSNNTKGNQNRCKEAAHTEDTGCGRHHRLRLHALGARGVGQALLLDLAYNPSTPSLAAAFTEDNSTKATNGHRVKSTSIRAHVYSLRPRTEEQLSQDSGQQQQ